MNLKFKATEQRLPVCRNETDIPHVTYDNLHAETEEFLIRANYLCGISFSCCLSMSWAQSLPWSRTLPVAKSSISKTPLMAWSFSASSTFSLLSSPLLIFFSPAKSWCSRCRSHMHHSPSRFPRNARRSSRCSWCRGYLVRVGLKCTSWLPLIFCCPHFSFPLLGQPHVFKSHQSSMLHCCRHHCRHLRSDPEDRNTSRGWNVYSQEYVLPSSLPPPSFLHPLYQKVPSIPWLTSSLLSLQKSPALPWKSAPRVYLVARPKLKVCRALGQI